MKKLFLGLLFIGLGLVSIQHFSKMEVGLDDAKTRFINEYYESQVLDNKIRAAVNQAKTIDDLDRIESQLTALSKTDRERITPTIALKKSAILFNQAEDYLRKAIEIENAVADSGGPVDPMPPPDPENTHEAIPPPAQPRLLHPLTTAHLNKAFVLYEQARKGVEKLKDSGDADFDYHLNYLKGEIYYRILELMADQESAPELFNQALTYYKYALRNRNSDINTVVNIELMIKNQNGLIGNAGNPQARKKQMLNSKKYGIGKSSGN
jgi:tetratricopeptide (TPR) repeat protein